jgi:GTP cyclohydrolase I
VGPLRSFHETVEISDHHLEKKTKTSHTEGAPFQSAPFDFMAKGPSKSMFPKLKEVLAVLDSLAPFSLAEPWDNPGLQVGSSAREIKKIFIALDPTLEMIRQARQVEAQLFLTHHPLIFKPLSSLDVDTYPGNVIFEALSGGISVVALHTNLDSAKGGINDILARLLDLRNIRVLAPASVAADAGLGRIGDLTKPVTLSELADRVKSLLGTEHLRLVGEAGKTISSVAVLGGSGGGMLSHAVKAGADLFLTGDINHHHALEARSLDLALMDAGHFLTEKAALNLFAKGLAEAFRQTGWDMAVEFGSRDRDPIWLV